jgi:hypothetical protein
MKIINCNIEIDISNTTNQKESLKEIIDNTAMNINKSINETFSNAGIDVDKVLISFDIEHELSSNQIDENSKNIEFGCSCKECKCDECETKLD